MIVLGIDIRVRWPVHLQRVRDWWCPDCQRYQDDGKFGVCQRCYRRLRRVQP